MTSSRESTGELLTFVAWIATCSTNSTSSRPRSFTHNQVSIHTSPGCTLPTNLDMTSSLTTGSYNSYDCSSANTDSALLHLYLSQMSHV